MINVHSEPSLDFIRAQSEGPVYRSIVERARSMLDATVCRVLVAEGGQFVLRANGSSASTDTQRPLPLTDNFLREVYSRRTPCVIDDLTDVRSAAVTAASAADSEPLRSLLMIPSDTIGLFIAADERTDHFSEAETERVVQLLTFAEHALDRIHSQARQNARGESLEEIIGTYAHDLRSPLQVAMGNLSIAQDSGEDLHLEKVTGALDRMDELLGDMARLATTGKHVDDLQEVELERIAEKAWTSVPTEDATLRVEDTLQIYADESRLRQLLENLFHNAVDHSYGDVCVRLGMLDSGFYVEDDGPGIPVEDREEVFEWQTSSSENHSGMGLRIVKSIVDAHGWEIDIHESVDGGTRFEIIT